MGAQEFADRLRASGTVRSVPLYAAFCAVDRRNFVSRLFRPSAYQDRPMPIGHGQTISQPSTVGFMLDLLDVRLAQKILDVGAGSGWTTALLAHLVGPSGRVYGVERIPQLVRKGQRNLEKVSYPWASMQQADERVVGLPAHAPYDRILVSAAANIVPSALIKQLASPGVMVLPVGNGLVRVLKDEQGNTTSQTFPGFIFVPLITK